LNAIQVVSIFMLSLAAALSGIYRTFQRERYLGELSGLKDRLYLLIRCAGNTFDERSDASRFFARVLSGGLSAEERSGAGRIFVQLQLQEYLSGMDDELSSRIIDLIRDYEEITIRYAAKLSIPSALIAFRCRLQSYRMDWSELLVSLPSMPGTPARAT
jgi:hypothetical protein